MSLGNWDPFGSWSDNLAAQRRAALDVARAAARLPAYAREWARAGLQPSAIGPDDWADLPILSKEMLVEAAADEPPFGRRLAVPQSELAHVFVAPGPLYMPFTGADLAHVAGSFARALTACGLEPGDLVDQTTMYNWVIAATVIDRALERIGCAVIPGGVGQSERHLEVIRATGANAIVAFPTFLEHLLELASADGHPLPLRKAVVMGELSHPDAKQRILDRHDIEVREFYGTADVGAVAWECSARSGMHLREDILVDFVRPGGSIPVVPSPADPAEIVVTDFGRRAMPIVRLRTGDLVDTLSSGPCPCGLTSPRIARIVGRASEITKVKGMFVVPRQVQEVLHGSGHPRSFRLVVDRLEGGRDRLTVEVAGDAPEDREALKARIEQALRIRVDMRFVDLIAPDSPRLVDNRAEQRR